MVAVTRAEATAQVRRTIAAYRDRVHEVRNDTDRLPPAGARIVDEYCLDRNDEQTLVLKAIGTSAFLDGMDDALLLEYCAVCMELDAALGLGSWRIGKVDRIIGVADLSRSEKIKRAIECSDVLGEILEEIGDINALAVQMVAVSAVLIGLAATGYGAVAEALGLALLAVGAALAGADFIGGISGLVKFFTAVDDAKSEEDLKSCGRLFGDAVAKIGVNGLFFVLSMFGLKKASARITTKTIADNSLNARKWKGKKIEERNLQLVRKYAAGYDTHMIEGYIGQGQKGVVGAHNRNSFIKILTNAGFDVKKCIINEIEHSFFKGLSEIDYQLPAKNGYGQFSENWKHIPHPKTVYDNSIYSDLQILEWGKEAMENAVPIGNNVRSITGTAKNGMRFQGYIDVETGEITNFHPIF